MPPLAPCFAHAAPLLRPASAARLQPRLRVVRVAPARSVVWSGLAEPEKEEVSVPEAPADAPVPGKIVLNDIQLAEQRTALKAYTEELKRKRFEEEREASRLFGWVPYAETLNGRLAMFFIVTGLLTEYWTGYTIPEQIDLMFRTLGVY